MVSEKPVPRMTAGDNGGGLWEQREDGVLLTRWGVYEVLMGLQTYLATVPSEPTRTIADDRLIVLDQLRRELQNAILNAVSPPAEEP